MPLSNQRKATAIGSPYDHGEPITRMSIIPMVSVFALINIVILATIPAPQHVLTIELPLIDSSYGIEGVSDPIYNRVSVASDATITWNGAPVSAAQLADLLNATLSQPVEPYVLFMPDPDAAYGDVLPVLNLVRMSGITDFCFGGLEQHRHLVGSTADSHAFPGLALASAVRLDTLTMDLPPDQQICDQLAGLNQPPPRS